MLTLVSASTLGGVILRSWPQLAAGIEVLPALKQVGTFFRVCR
jgi:hypothetical protein